MSDLFREEAVRHSTRRLSGEIVLATSLSSKWLTALICVPLAVALLFAATATYARRETVVGSLVPSAGMIRVTARNGGTVERTFVEEGQDVASNAVLMRLNHIDRVSVGEPGSELSRELADERSAVGQEYESKIAQLENERRELTERRSILASQLQQATILIELQRERLQLAQAEVDRAKGIADRGFLPKREVELRRSEAIATRQRLAELVSARLAAQREVADVDGRLRAIPLEVRELTAAAAVARSTVNQKTLEADARALSTLRAPVAGRVVGLPAHQGQTLPAGGVAALLIPVGSRLEAELYAPSRAAGFVRPGQVVRLKYAAFPYEKFGFGRGVVRSVSRTVLAPSDISVPGVELREPVFRIVVTLERDSVLAYGTPVPLQPGMLVNAEIVLEKRSLLEWLFDPIFAAAGKR